MLLKLTDEQRACIRDHFPEEGIPPNCPGRRPVSVREVLNATLWILATGAQWRMLPQGHSNCKTVRGHFQQWRCGEVLRDVLTDMRQAHRMFPTP